MHLFIQLFFIENLLYATQTMVILLKVNNLFPFINTKYYIMLIFSIYMLVIIALPYNY